MPSSQLSDVPALVLGAGFGTRLRPLTEIVPKPAVPVLGRPLIGYPLIHAYAAGVRTIWVNSHHRSERLVASVEPWAQRRLLRLALRWSDEQPAILGTGGALKKLEPQLGGRGPILLLNGDSILAMDLPALWAAHQRNRQRGAIATLLCVPSPEAARFGAVRVAPDGRVLDLAGLAGEPLPGEGTACIFAGAHVLEPAVLGALPPSGTESCILRQGYAPLIREGAPVYAALVPPGSLFHDLGTPDRYLDAQRDLFALPPSVLPVAEGVDAAEALFQEASYAVDASGREYGSPDAVEGLAGAHLEPPFFFGPRNEVAAGAHIGPNASVGALNRIGGAARLSDCALWSQVELDSVVHGAILARLDGALRVAPRAPTSAPAPR